MQGGAWAKAATAVLVVGGRMPSYNNRLWEHGGHPGPPLCAHVIVRFTTRCPLPHSVNSSGLCVHVCKRVPDSLPPCPFPSCCMRAPSHLESVNGVLNHQRPPGIRAAWRRREGAFELCSALIPQSGGEGPQRARRFYRTPGAPWKAGLAPHAVHGPRATSGAEWITNQSTNFQRQTHLPSFSR